MTAGALTRHNFELVEHLAVFVDDRDVVLDAVDPIALP